MKKPFKWLAVVLCLALVFTAFAACGGGDDKETTTVAETSSGEESKVEPISLEDGKVFNIGICQYVQHEALDEATRGFKEALEAKLGKDHVKFDTQNASAEKTNCTTIISKFVSDKVDLILANATDPLAAAAEATSDIPIVGTSVTDYATALGIKEGWTGKTGFNVTGTADLAPLDEQANMVKELCPDAKTVGILYCSAEANSKYQSTVIQESLKKLGYECKEYTFADTNDIISVTTEAAKNSDVIYIPTDNKAADNTEAINNVVEPLGKPVIAGEEGICKGCGVATLSISYYDIGYKAGEMAVEILVNGAKPGDMEIQYAKNLTKKYIKDRADALKITIPSDYVAIEAK